MPQPNVSCVTGGDGATTHQREERAPGCHVAVRCPAAGYRWVGWRVWQGVVLCVDLALLPQPRPGALGRVQLLAVQRSACRNALHAAGVAGKRLGLAQSHQRVAASRQSKPKLLDVETLYRNHCIKHACRRLASGHAIGQQ